MMALMAAVTLLIYSRAHQSVDSSGDS